MSPTTLRAVIAQAQALTTLAGLLATASLDDLLDQPGPFTIFATTDTAFAKLAPADLAALRADLPRLRAALNDHLFPGTLVAADLMALSALTTLSGLTLTLDRSSGLRLADAYLSDADVIVANGVLHQIGTVLLLR